MPRVRGKIEIHKDDTKNLPGKRLPNPATLWVAFMFLPEEHAPFEILKGVKIEIHDQFKHGKSIPYDLGNVELPPHAGRGRHYYCKIVVILGGIEGEPPDGPVVHKGDFALEDIFPVDIRHLDREIKLDTKVLRMRQTCSARVCHRCGR